MNYALSDKGDKEQDGADSEGVSKQVDAAFKQAVRQNYCENEKVCRAAGGECRCKG